MEYTQSLAIWIAMKSVTASIRERGAAPEEVFVPFNLPHSRSRDNRSCTLQQKRRHVLLWPRLPNTCSPLPHRKEAVEEVEHENTRQLVQAQQAEGA
jgi:hypothetical protein